MFSLGEAIYVFRSLIPFLSALILSLTLALVASSSDLAAGELGALGASMSDGTPRIVVRGSYVAGTNLTIIPEGCPPPTTNPPVPPFMLVIRLNGWTSATPVPTWDEENQVWVITYRIPPGAHRATLGITAMMFGTGNSTSSTVTVQ